MTRRTLLASAPLFAARYLHAQEAPTFSAGVKVVNVFATVRDRKGLVVRNLTKEDFILEEEGHPQVIRYFSQESNLPLTVGLLVDTSGSTRNVLPDERRASFRFLRQVMREDKDMAFVIHFDFEAELLQDLTGSHDLLEKALNLLEPVDMRQRLQQRGRTGNGGGGGWGYPGGGRRGGRGRGGYPGGYPGGGQGPGRGSGGTVLYDAVYLASDELMRKQKGRKALIVLSDGEDNGSKETLLQSLESAQRADTLAYTILFQDPDMDLPRFGRRGVDGKQVMQKIARETGGRFFEVSKRMPIEKVFAEIEEDLRNQYSLGYTPEAGSNRGYRSIRLTTKRKDLLIQTREGYYSS